MSIGADSTDIQQTKIKVVAKTATHGAPSRPQEWAGEDIKHQTRLDLKVY